MSGIGSLRICAPFSELAEDKCSARGRCQTRQCELCGQDVHYDPKASIPELGPETIVCVGCFDKALAAERETMP